ncbi:sigma-70 family RNA polymerase sigma factor [Christiangramia sp. OXR-203]|uniref:RNA polymerase sigma factor n=1 Tax=Christiangramia sp. OXR-203 TaxID=3100176 RepID=UPI002AC9CE8F|nr:sigma-70 family RNA polymerase sigma factor [Christiangramia sp. OXR-203]WPY99848.1 sigma-70 family RNA polymerase sigma factor [Christiangramia sp. OXR-203]
MSIDYHELLSTGYPCAFEKIHARYSHMVFWLGKGIISDDFVVESLVQDTFLKLWANRAKIKSEKHLFFFLRMVMKRECYTYYTSPKHKFFRKINALESYENYQDYLAGYDPKDDVQVRQEQEAQQEAFEQITKVLPLLKPERKRLIELCLKYGFKYKSIARVMGTSITDISNEVKRAIEDIKVIIKQGSQLETISKPTKAIKGQEMSEEQEKVLELRLIQKFSFSAIADELKLSQEEVHKEFIAAYKYMQVKREEQLESA